MPNWYERYTAEHPMSGLSLVRNVHRDLTGREEPLDLAREARQRFYERPAQTVLDAAAMGPAFLGELASPAFEEAAMLQAQMPMLMPMQARWKRAGVPRERIQALAEPRDPLHQRIGERDVWYHATSPQNVPEILRTGEIRPLGMAEQAKETLLAQDAPVGVSVSRVPRVASKADKAVSFVIDREKMPPSRPLAERGYEKTEPGKGVEGHFKKYLSQDDLVELSQIEREGRRLADAWKTLKTQTERNTNMVQRQALINRAAAIEQRGFAHVPAWQASDQPNSRFEFEQRTYNRPVPLSAVREILVDASAFPRKELESGFGRYGVLKDAQEYGIPVRIISSGRALHSERAARARRFYKRAGAAE